MVNILTIKAFEDNYIWLIKNSQSQHCIVIDPGDASPVLKVLESQQLIVDAILLTHHHNDHTGGVEALLSAQDESIELYSKDKLFPQSRLVDNGQVLTFFDGQFSLQVMEMPGHTLDHVGYYNESYLFCGDTLFSGGCGRLFEGTHDQMHTALNRIAELADETEVYCAHEYTQANLKFALQVDSKNQHLLDYIRVVSKKRQQGLPTIPTTIGLEKQINPFLRCQDDSIINALQSELNEPITSSQACFKALRMYKDRF